VVLETTGRRSGKQRLTPLARGPVEGDRTWLISVHGRHADWVRNIEANPSVRIRLGRRWRSGEAAVQAYDPKIALRFNSYARGGPKLLGIDPVLVQIELGAASRT
jgi:deazaflavin-dependent oxidoreductase (nitroreductase family)